MKPIGWQIVLTAWLVLLCDPVRALEPTTETGIGVWYQPGAPATTKLWQAGDPGEQLVLRLIVRSVEGRPLGGTLIELWQGDGGGTVHAERYRSRVETAADGSATFHTALPGYVWRARHIHLLLTHPNHRRLITRVLFLGDPLLAEMAYPELAIALEQGRIGDTQALFGTAQIVMRP